MQSRNGGGQEAEAKFSQLHRVHPQWSWGAKSSLNFMVPAVELKRRLRVVSSQLLSRRSAELKRRLAKGRLNSAHPSRPEVETTFVVGVVSTYRPLVGSRPNMGPIDISTNLCRKT